MLIDLDICHRYSNVVLGDIDLHFHFQGQQFHFKYRYLGNGEVPGAHVLYNANDR